MTKQDAETKLTEALQLLERCQGAMANAIQQVTHWQGYVAALTDAEQKPAPVAKLVKGRRGLK